MSEQQSAHDAIESLSDEEAARTLEDLDDLLEEEDTGVNRLSQTARDWITQSKADTEALRKCRQTLEKGTEPTPSPAKDNGTPKKVGWIRRAARRIKRRTRQR